MEKIIPKRPKQELPDHLKGPYEKFMADWDVLPWGDKYDMIIKWLMVNKSKVYSKSRIASMVSGWSFNLQIAEAASALAAEHRERLSKLCEA